MPGRNFLLFELGNLGLDFLGSEFPGAFFTAGTILGAFLAIDAFLPAFKLSGTKLCLFAGGAVDLRAVGCLVFLEGGSMLWKLALLEDFLLLRDCPFPGDLGLDSLFLACKPDLSLDVELDLEWGTFFLDWDGLFTPTGCSSSLESELGSREADLGSRESGG